MMRKNTLAVAIAAALASVAPLHGASAQQAAAPGASTPGQTELEEVVVTGMRASLETSMDMKRDAIGVVDAISAEDIGKFPDSNLSESLQRITGISIDRRNGEGALVTARGFGAQFNMVTLNGRTMPAADAFAGGNSGDGGVAGQTRAFNFANLASESISAIEVYKTGRADQATGGIGATLNVRTARPFDSDEPVMNVGVKAIADTTNRVGDDITPEVSGIFSFANDDKTWGVGLSASYQKRDSGSSSSTINDWNIRTWNPGNQTTLFASNATIVNAPATGSLYAIPNDIRYHFSDRERERTNAQLTVQFAPTDTLTLTADYTYAENDLTEDRGDQTLWMNANRYSLAEFDTGHAVATPLVLQEDEGTAKDFGFEQQHREQRNELKSIGFNAEWHVTDTFSLSLDLHDSKAESLPDDPVTGGGETLFSFAARVPSTCAAAPNQNLCTNRFQQTFRFNDGLALAQRTLFAQPTTGVPGSGGDPSYAFQLSDLGSQYLRINYQEQTSDITQARIDGNLKFENDSRVQFGVETRAMESRQRASNAQMTLGDWGVARPGELPGNLLQPFSLVGEFNDFATTGVPRSGWKGNANALARWAVQTYGTWRDSTQTNGVLEYNPAFDQDHTISEDSVAAYVQYGMNFDLFSRNANLLVGVRYEKTDVEAVSNQLLPRGLIWQDNNDFSEWQGISMVTLKEKNDYDYVLPNLDFDIEVVDNVKARFSYSKTIARAQYNQLRSAIDVGGSQGSTLNGMFPQATEANPQLQPLESDNIDLSMEWYFADASYLSAGFFHKKVANFIGQEVQQRSLFGITDQTGGPRAQQARDELRARGFGTDDTNLFVMMAMIENPGSFTANGTTWTGGAANFNGTEAQHLAFATRYDLFPNASDPAYQFNVTRPVNNKDANIYGWELGGQHFFGQSGFGIQANYTIVKGDVSFNDAGDPNVNQFALLGLSDSANLILMYEDYGFQVRLAYNWRDEFLQNTNRGNFRNPEYVEEYYQVDLSVGYEVNENLTLSLEGLNLTEQDIRWHGRSVNQPWYVEDQGARYALGARYKF